MAEIDVGKDVPASNGTTTMPGAADVLSALGTTVPADATPTETTPADTTPADTAPTDIAPADIAPADIAPADIAPADIAPADIAPADIAPADATPTDIAPSDIAPADIAPADIAPADATPTDIAPSDIAPADTTDTWAAAAASAGQDSGAQPQPDSTPDAGTQPTDAAATWEEFGQASLVTSAVMEEVAAEHLQNASEWAAYGNIDAAKEELAEAQVAAELGAESAAIASAEFELAAEYREHGEDGSSTAADNSPAGTNDWNSATPDQGSSEPDSYDDQASADNNRD
jgi:hypothetical protein